MSTNISVKIDVKKIDKAKLFVGEKGTYLDATIIMRDEPDQYGNCGMVVQNVTKEEREAGVKGIILGNVKWIQKQPQQVSGSNLVVNTDTPEPIDDLPF
jgi:hypothetical protein